MQLQTPINFKLFCVKDSQLSISWHAGKQTLHFYIFVSTYTFNLDLDFQLTFSTYIFTYTQPQAFNFFLNMNFLLYILHITARTQIFQKQACQILHFIFCSSQLFFFCISIFSFESFLKDFEKDYKELAVLVNTFFNRVYGGLSLNFCYTVHENTPFP